MLGLRSAVGLHCNVEGSLEQLHEVGDVAEAARLTDAFDRQVGFLEPGFDELKPESLKFAHGGGA